MTDMLKGFFDDPGLVISAAVVIAFVFSVIDFKVRERRNAEDPRAVLRRCRVELDQVRRKLERIPATKEAHAILAGIASAQLTIDATEAVFARKERNG
jgi:hypothetical protein